MVLKERNDKKAKLIKQSFLASGPAKVKVYSSSTGSSIIYSLRNGKEHVSISNHLKPPTMDEINFVAKKLMKSNENIEIVPPSLRNYQHVINYVAHIYQK